MATLEKTIITIETNINAPVDKVWKFWTEPYHIKQWNNASEDWFTPRSENDVRTGGRFVSRMEAKDGSEGFDFEGVYTNVVEHKLLEYVLGDGRKVQIFFIPSDIGTKITENFEAESLHSTELQKTGWNSILQNFKRYVESKKNLELLHYEIEIDAPADKVYNIMLGKDSYSEWTSIFNPSSSFEGSWEKGSKMLFLGEDNGKQEE
ncbi:MAG: hypothetical protein HC906_19915 [Bacteroidales bacterium]|nr:hypothetical protein [Bacteroidales bacterium]